MRISDWSSDVFSSDLPTSIANNNLAGYRPANTSKLTGSVTAHARFDMSDDLKLDITGVAAGRSKFYHADNKDPVFGIQKGYVKLDLLIQKIGSAEGRERVCQYG